MSLVSFVGIRTASRNAGVSRENHFKIRPSGLFPYPCFLLYFNVESWCLYTTIPANPRKGGYFLQHLWEPQKVPQVWRRPLFLQWLRRNWPRSAYRQTRLWIDSTAGTESNVLCVLGCSLIESKPRAVTLQKCQVKTWTVILEICNHKDKKKTRKTLDAIHKMF